MVSKLVAEIGPTHMIWQIDRLNKNRPQQQEQASTVRQEQWGMAQQYIQHYGVALDCGAHIGECTQQYAERFQQVIAVEPNSTFHECWHLNCDHLTHVQLHTQALGDCEGRMQRDNPLAQVLTVHEEGEIQMPTLDSMGLTQLDFIKIDVDGSEARLLQGATQTILKLQPVIQIEIKKNRRPEVRLSALEQLRDLGYKSQARVRSDWIYTT